MHHVPAAENRLSEVKNGFNQSGARPPCRGLTHCRAGVWMHKGQSHRKAQKDKASKAGAAAAMAPAQAAHHGVGWGHPGATEPGGTERDGQGREGWTGIDRDREG